MQEILWGYKYVTVGDARVRADHQQFEGVTLPKDDKFWDTFTPPNGYQCRCMAIPIFSERPAVKPPRNIEPIDEDFEFHPGKAVQ